MELVFWLFGYDRFPLAIWIITNGRTITVTFAKRGLIMICETIWCILLESLQLSLVVVIAVGLYGIILLTIFVIGFLIWENVDIIKERTVNWIKRRITSKGD